MNKLSVLVAAAIVAGFATAGTALADSNILFILDASGSMYGKIDGQPKIATAKKEMADLLAQLPAGSHVGLMTYGSKSKSDCSDISLLSPIGVDDTTGVTGQLADITPLGKTPIAAALAQSADAFADLKGQNNNVVLISDGIESCDGDPCAAASALAGAGIGVRVDVVGFGLSAEDEAALRCIADNGNGKYFSANSTAGFTDAIKQVVDVAETNPTPAPAPSPAPAANTTYFSDEFNGTDLDAKNWKVINPNADGYVVEDGGLLTVSSATGGLGNADTPNIFDYVGAVPAGDYEVSVVFNMEFATGAEQFQVGLYDDNSNFIAASLAANANCCNSTIQLRITKMSGGQTTGFDVPVIKLPSQDTFPKEANATPQPITLKLVKSGHAFHAEVTFAGLKDDNGEPLTVKTEPVTSLRPPKALVMNLSQQGDTTGETNATVDSVTITTPVG